MISNLYSAKKMSTVRVTSIPEICLLENIGLRTGTKATVQTRYALGGPILLRVENAYSVAIGKDIAMQIGVEGADS